MAQVIVDFSKNCGIVKPMHSVNNGPAGSDVRKTSNAKYFQEAKIPYARNHDAAFNAGYGGEFTVDVHNIFRNFDADVNDPASYDFEMTDAYLKRIEAVGTETFYRLGTKIEHGKKFATIPPKNFQKWAEICEHIIRHYNEGWASGFSMNLKYWEIWNEPDCENPDGTNPCWQGTKEQFTDFFVTAIRHLKKCFPDLKIGGPALYGDWTNEYAGMLFEALQKESLYMDFFSFHCYTRNPYDFDSMAERAYALLEQYKCVGKTELVLNEWNYVRDWCGEEFQKSIRSIKGLKGASFTAAVMCVGQRSRLDHLMYYDARPCAFNGMFDTDLLFPLKGYYPFLMYSKLYEMGGSVVSESDDADIYCVAAKGERGYGLLVTHFTDVDDATSKEVKFVFKNLDGDKLYAEFFVLDEKKDMELVQQEILETKEYTKVLSMPAYTTYYIRIFKEKNK